MSEDLIEQIKAIIRDPISVGVFEEELRWVDDVSRAIASLIAEEVDKARKEGCAWAEAIERWFAIWQMVPDWSAADPWTELNRMLGWEQQVAFDPAVSEDARTLRASARREALEEAAAYIDCGCECRPMVMMALTTSERAAQRVCTSNNTCVAIEAAAIRSLAKEATNGQ